MIVKDTNHMLPEFLYEDNILKSSSSNLRPKKSVKINA